MQKILFTLSLLCIVMIGCKKNPQVKEQDLPGVVRDRGMATLPPRTFNIGAAGGKIESLDGKMVVTIPQGAVSTETVFTIEQLSNTLPGSFGPAYRLKPEAQALSKLVTITYHYELSDLDSVAQDALFLSYQEENGIWHFIPQTTLNKTTRTLSAETKKLGDWAPYSLVWMSVSNRSLPFNATTNISIQTTENFGKFNPTKESIAIAAIKQLDKPAHIKEWKLQGAGKLEEKDNGQTALYIAPAEAPSTGHPNVQVQVNNFLPAGLSNRNAAILSAQIHIQSPPEVAYFSGTIDGMPFFTDVNLWRYADDDFVNIEGWLGLSENITISVKMKDQLKWGTFAWYMEQGTEIAQLAYQPWGPVDFISGYKNCSNLQFYSDGYVFVKIEQVQGVTYLTGEFKGYVYERNKCDPAKKRIEGIYHVPFFE